MVKRAKTAPRNRSAEALAAGRRLITAEISAELDALIDRVRDRLARDLGRCTRAQALEAMGRAGGKILLEKEST